MSDGIDVIFSASLFLIAVVVFVIKKLIKERMLKFRSIETNMTPDQQCSYLRWVIEEKLKWEITEINEYLIIARTPESAGNPMGETVTIVFDSGRILLNSIGDLKHYRYHSITAFGWNRHNLNILTEYIGDTQDRD